MKNPYSLVFGRTPQNYIDRDNEINEIIETFLDDEPSIRAYILTGLRGSGKTVCLSKIEKILRNENDFVVISLNSDMPLLEEAYEELYYILNKNNFLKDIDVSVTVTGVNLKLNKKQESANFAIQKLLECASIHHKKILFCIDEISNTQNIKSFCQAFNIWLRKDYNVLLLMTGLKKNVLSLQGDNRVSFFKRAEKIEIGQLSINQIKNNYQNVLKISEQEAAEMAIFSKGYSYAFQVLGYLCVKNSKSYKDIIEEFDEKMANNVYDIIWEDLTDKEKKIIKILLDSDLTTATILRNEDINPNIYNEYRSILITKGLIKDIGYGKVEFTLPRFSEIGQRQIKLGFWRLDDKN